MKHTNQKVSEKNQVANLRILVVDDEALNRKVIRGMLKNVGIKPDEAEDGEKCLHMVEEKEYDIVFMDYMMVGMDGVETLNLIKKNDKASGNPIFVAVTANVTGDTEEMCRAAGFDDFLSKPVLSERLTGMIEKWSWHIGNREEVEPFEHDFTDMMSLIRKEVKKHPFIDMEYAERFYSGFEDFWTALLDFYDLMEAEAEEVNDIFIELKDAEDETGCIKRFEIKIHAMKSAAKYIGLVELAGTAGMLERGAARGDREMVVTIFPYFLREWKKTKKQLMFIKQYGNGI